MGAHVNAKNSIGETPLMIAMRNGFYKIVKYLLSLYGLFFLRGGWPSIFVVKLFQLPTRYLISPNFLKYREFTEIFDSLLDSTKFSEI
jgi:ankyrin repeat protein